MGIACTGKDVLPVCDELNPNILRERLLGEPTKVSYTQEGSTSPTRPPVLCAGCPHRGFFYAVAKEKNIVASGDIGCYTLGMSEPLNAIDTVICMGASVSAGIGMQKAFDIKGVEKKVFSFIGDSTFFHSGITGLVNSVYNNIPTVTVIMDNRITAMTGHQENPGTGKTLMGEKATEVDIPGLVLALGVKPQNIKIVNPYMQEESRAVIKEAKMATEPFVIITQEPCALIKDVQKKRKNMYCAIDQEKCKKCKTCVRTGCPAIYIKDGEVLINRDACNGCTLCFQACPFQAIEKKGDLLNV
jgi:indolepyruvate ferredoxin oxidoreductase alpha subunit